MARFGSLGGRGEGREVRLRQSRMAEAGERVAVLVEGDHRGDHRIVRGGEFDIGAFDGVRLVPRSEEHTSELQSLMRSSYAVFCLTKKKHISTQPATSITLTTQG